MAWVKVIKPENTEMNFWVQAIFRNNLLTMGTQAFGLIKVYSWKKGGAYLLNDRLDSNTMPLQQGNYHEW